MFRMDVVDHITFCRSRQVVPSSVKLLVGLISEIMLRSFSGIQDFVFCRLPVGTPDLGDPLCVPGPAQCWVWLVDLERTVALLVGRCLGGMLQGAPPSPEEQNTAHWLKTPLFSNGLETDIPQLGMHTNSFITTEAFESVCA